MASIPNRLAAWPLGASAPVGTHIPHHRHRRAREAGHIRREILREGHTVRETRDREHEDGGHR